MSKKQSLDSILESGKSRPIGAVERDTGIARDTLRVWQRRYGFPSPVRNQKGERLYPAKQVRRLQLIRRLLDQGLRPGKIVPLSEPALHQLEAKLYTIPGEEHEENVVALIAHLKEHDSEGIEVVLEEILAVQGLRAFVQNTVAPLVKSVGESWARGELDVYEEHFMSQLLIRFLNTEIARLEIASSPNPVLLGTLPGEKHGIGLLMTAAILASENITAINLGVEMPLDQLVPAAEKFNSSVVGLTFSGAYPYGSVRSHLQELRARLPATTNIWAGGHAMGRIRKLPTGVKKIISFDELPIATIR